MVVAGGPPPSLVCKVLVEVDPEVVFGLRSFLHVGRGVAHRLSHADRCISLVEVAEAVATLRSFHRTETLGGEFAEALRRARLVAHDLVPMVDFVVLFLEAHRALACQELLLIFSCNACALTTSHNSELPGQRRSVRGLAHPSGEVTREAICVRHILVLDAGSLLAAEAEGRLLLEEHEVRIVGSLLNAGEVEGVMDLVFGVEHLVD